ncbi:MbtH-like protein [Vibrio ruber DSM 16370]|uniref:MbtH-like protein n=1 Tax=Vibrio ruber (strain DSM 16370 / JCM 11486 / BCRC 17186 / CECT 7878 / LMG 23124 / VR1) TaxID=1123498 RepID=A0A1R4LIF5_VIBR1|nr:MbtH family protein [Vibrio ruber]SJN56295.1 MbtH-like protein [Vibrio ruber DSM 16370]
MNDKKYTNPFDDVNHRFLVLTNDRGQYSLWPEFSLVPQGWQAIFGPDDKSACLSYVEQNWQHVHLSGLNS